MPEHYSKNTVSASAWCNKWEVVAELKKGFAAVTGENPWD